MLNTLTEADSSPYAAPLRPVYTQNLPQLPASGKVLSISLYIICYGKRHIIT